AVSRTRVVRLDHTLHQPTPSVRPTMVHATVTERFRQRPDDPFGRSEPTGEVNARRRSADALGDLAGLEAAGAHVDPLGRAVDDGPHPLDVRVPPALGAPVRVADVHPEGRVL